MDVIGLTSESLSSCVVWNLVLVFFQLETLTGIVGLMKCPEFYYFDGGKSSNSVKFYTKKKHQRHRKNVTL